MVLHGFNRGTEDIDLLVDKATSNIALLKKALSILPKMFLIAMWRNMKLYE